MTIQLAPGSESLNVATAGAIALYEFKRAGHLGPVSSPPGCRKGAAIEPAVARLDVETSLLQ